MSPQRWTRIQDLFAVAVQQPADKRSAFLDECCGSDDDLRHELESLLAASSQAGAFLETPAMQIAGCEATPSPPTQRPGDLIGPYELVTPLGKGGMGEVWRAHDARVARDVAIKFCDTRFSARFEHEARAIAALNHPNICQLYDVGPNYLVMELVEGQPPHGPVSLANSLRSARQVAEALEAAHERGIVHRDLKPANVRIRLDGTVKVLDFGVARFDQTREDKSCEKTEHSDGIALTQAGSVVGTPAWMSPEQTLGQKVDRRTDIWAFGLLLYYCLTGSNPYERSTLAETQKAVLTYEPHFGALPAEVRRLVRKCLEKDVKRRLRDIGDAWELLETPGDPARSSASRNRVLALAAAALAVFALAAIVWFAPLTRTQADRLLMRFDLDLGAEVALGSSGTADFVLSPDGRKLAYVSHGKLFLHDFEQTAAKQVGSVQGVHSPFFSPDGNWIGFFAQGKLRKISVQGGAAVDICPTSAYFSGAAWGPDDFITASLTPSGPLQQVPASGGPATPITELDRARGETTHRLPQYLPGGRAILFTTHDAITGFDDAAIEVMRLSDRKRKLLIKGGTFGRYVQSGHVLYISRGVLYAVPFDVTRLEVRGTPVALVRDVAYSLYGSAQLDVSSSGMLVYRAGGPETSSIIVRRFGAIGEHQPLLSRPGVYLNPRVSPDGHRLLLATRETDELSLSVYDWRRGVLNTLVQYPAGSPSVVWAPFAIWTPDGKFVVFRGERGMFWVRSDSVGQPHRLTTSSMSQTPSAFSPDGRTLLYYEGAGLVGSSDMWAASIQYADSGMTANEARPVVKTKADENQAAFSADGRWLAYVAADAASPQVFVRPWPDDGRTWQISSEGGSQPRFGASGTQLFYLNQDEQLMSVRFSVAGSDFVAERPRLWSESRLASVGATFWSYDTLPEQDGVVALAIPDQSHRPPHNRLAVLLNVFEHLRRVAPVR